jgi:hypothetical protein
MRDDEPPKTFGDFVEETLDYPIEIKMTMTAKDTVYVQQLLISDFARL